MRTIFDIIRSVGTFPFIVVSTTNNELYFLVTGAHPTAQNRVAALAYDFNHILKHTGALPEDTAAFELLYPNDPLHRGI